MMKKKPIERERESMVKEKKTIFSESSLSNMKKNNIYHYINILYIIIY